MQCRCAEAAKPARATAKARPAERAEALAAPRVRLGNQAVLRTLGLGAVSGPGGLRLSSPGDAAEREADQVADQVMRMAGPSGLAPEVTSEAAPHLQRTCAACEEEVHRQEDEPGEAVPATRGAEDASAGDEVADDDDEFDEDDDSGWPKLEAGAARPAPVVPRAVVPKSEGRPLEPAVARFMGERFGRDFGAVRVHTDAAAAGSARQLNARAYTVGRDIYFKEGRYSPGGVEGRRLLAHELTHVVQQDRAPALVQRQDETGAETQEAGGGGDAGTADVAPGEGGPVEEGPGGKGKGGSAACSQAGCAQGKAKKAVTGDCNSGGPPNDTGLYIKHLAVDVAAGSVAATWTDGHVDKFPCTGNVNGKKNGKKYGTPTPRGKDTIGVKCGASHTNQITKKRKVPDNMGWFTGLSKHGRSVGFHDSQPVGSGQVSHACIRVCCNHAKTINQNTWSGKTTVNVV